MKEKNSTRDEILFIINESMYPKILELLNDLGKEKITFKGDGINELSIKADGSITTKKDEDWVERTIGAEERCMYDSNAGSDILRRIMLCYAKALVSLREEKKVMDEAIQEVKDMGCLADFFEKKLIIEKS